MRALKAGVVYFLLVLAAGFVLGVIRERWVVPRIGERGAEMAEVPIMVGVSILAALWVVRRYDLRRSVWKRIAAGAIALALMIGAEVAIVPWLRGQSIEQYLASRDPVALAVYVVGLLLFAAMPAMVTGALGSRRRAGR